MAINFGEVFLREMGSAQDRASNMAELQLQANRFAAQQALAEAEFEVRKADAASARSFRAFQEEIGRAQEGRAQAQEERAVEMFEYEKDLAEINEDIAEYKRDTAKLNLQTLQEEQEYLNSTISQEKAEKHNLPLTTTNQEYGAYLDQKVREIALETEETQLQATKTAIQETAEAKQLSQEFTRQFMEMYDQPITLEEAPAFVDPSDQIGFFGKVGRGIAGGLLGASLLLGRSDSNIDPSLFELNPSYYNPTKAIREARDRLRFERQTGIRQEAAEEVVGKRPSELSGFSPEILDLMSRKLIMGTPFQTTYGAANILQQGAGMMTPTNFLQQFIQAQQQTPPEVEE